MRVCRIEGSVHSTVKDRTLAAEKILVARPVDLEGRPAGDPLLALDKVDAGEGDLVLVHKEGGGARILLDDDRSPVQCIVIAVIDDIRLEQ